MPQLRCLAPCGPAGAPYEPGRVYHFDEPVAARVMRGSPGSWEVIEGVVRVGGPDDFVNYTEPPPSAVARAPAAPAAGGAPPREELPVDLEALTVPELREMASARGVAVRGRMSRAALIDTIEAAEGGDDDSEDD